MRRFASNSLTVCLLVLTNCSISFGLVTYESSYSYNQDSFGGDFIGGEDGLIQNLARSVSTPNATFAFNTTVLPDNPFELRARAGLEVSIDGRGTDIGWQSVAASTTATTSLIDFGIVENFGNAQSGLIHFNWIVTGASAITLTPAIPRADAYVVDQLFTLASLTSTVESDIPEILLNEQSGQTTVNSFVPDSAGFQEFLVPWTANQEVPIVFDLEVVAALDITNFDAAGFQAVLDADFTNTATLDSVEIFDENGNLLSSASFIGQNNLVYAQGSGGGGVVPEPSSGIVWSLLGFCITLSEFRRRRKQLLSS